MKLLPTSNARPPIACIRAGSSSCSKAEADMFSISGGMHTHKRWSEEGAPNVLPRASCAPDSPCPLAAPWLPPQGLSCTQHPAPAYG